MSKPFACQLTLTKGHNKRLVPKASSWTLHCFSSYLFSNSSRYPSTPLLKPADRKCIYCLSASCLPFPMSLLYFRKNFCMVRVFRCDLGRVLFGTCDGEILILRQRNLSKQCLLRFLCLNIKIFYRVPCKAFQGLQH